MADFKGRKKGKSHIQNMGIFLVAQDMVLSYRAKFQVIIFFSGFQCILWYFYRTINQKVQSHGRYVSAGANFSKRSPENNLK